MFDKNSIKKCIGDKFGAVLTIISPELNSRVWYRIKSGKWPDLNNPTDFKEKLIKLKLEDYNHNPIVKQCADKFAVRSYVMEKLKGCPALGGGTE